MKKKHILIGAFSLSLILFSLIGSTIAYWNTSSSTVNKISMNYLKNQIIEDYDEPLYVMPSETIKKVVNVENLGSIDTIVRVKVKLALGDLVNDKFKEDITLDSSNIEIPYNTNYWTYDKTDGYFYYKSILKSGTITREPLFEQFTLNESIQNDYQEKVGKIIVTMESVQADNNGISLWNKSYEDLGIEKPNEKTDIPTTVTYLGLDKKFDIELNQLDLFANFKDLTPGATRTQRIQVRNESNEKVIIYLSADSVTQDWKTPEESILMSDLLNKYVTIKITDENKNILYDGPISGNLESNANTMKVGIDLGIFNTSQSKTFTVSLSVNPIVDNRYQKLFTKVKWIFAINGADTTIEEYKPSSDGSTTSKDNIYATDKKGNPVQGSITDGKATQVKTADSVMNTIYILLLLIGFSGTIYVTGYIQKQKIEDN